MHRLFSVTSVTSVTSVAFLTSVTSVAFVISVASVAAQDFSLQVGPPIAGKAPVAKNSIFVVRPGGCVDPASAQFTATAEGLVNGTRRSIPLTITALPAKGVHAVTKEQPTAAGVWIVNVVGTCAGKTAGALVAIGPKNTYQRDSVKLVAHRPTSEEIDASLKALTAGGQK